MRMMRRGAAIVAVMAALLVSSTAPAQATQLSPEVLYALRAEPGGVALTPTTAVWPALGMTLEVQSARAVGSCATGTICAYSGAALTGTRLTWTTCGTKSTVAISTVGSIANARSSGTLSARGSSGTVYASAGTGASANVAVANRPLVTNVSC